jgi:hypothetical protein
MKRFYQTVIENIIRGRIVLTEEPPLDKKKILKVVNNFVDISSSNKSRSDLWKVVSYQNNGIKEHIKQQRVVIYDPLKPAVKIHQNLLDFEKSCQRKSS